MEVNRQHFDFDLQSKFEPKGDQVRAINELTEGINKGEKYQTLLGATGTGKTFTIANIIKNVGKPTLVLAHNKTLAGQLYNELTIGSNISFLTMIISNQKHMYHRLIPI